MKKLESLKNLKFSLSQDELRLIKGGSDYGPKTFLSTLDRTELKDGNYDFIDDRCEDY